MEESELQKLNEVLETIAARQTVEMARYSALVGVLDSVMKSSGISLSDGKPLLVHLEAETRRIVDEMLRERADYSPALANRMAQIVSEFSWYDDVA